MKTNTIKTNNFIISYSKKKDIVINTKNLDWKITLSVGTFHYETLNYFIEKNTPDEINELLSMLYYTSITMLTDMKLTGIIHEYFEKKLQDAKAPKISDKEDKKILKQLKKEHNDRTETV